MWIVGSQGSHKNSNSHIDASHSRQPLVKGERLVRYEVNAVMTFSGMTHVSALHWDGAKMLSNLSASTLRPKRHTTTNSRPTRLHNYSILDSLRGASVNIGTIQRRLAWPLRKDDTHKSRSVKIFGQPLCPLNNKDFRVLLLLEQSLVYACVRFFRSGDFVKKG